MAAPRIRVILDNDYSGDPDGLVQLAHHALSPSVDIRAVIGSHLRAGDPFDPSDETADHAAARAAEVLAALGMRGRFPVVAGSNRPLDPDGTPIATAATEAIIREAMRDDTDRPLFVACGAGLTEVASAVLLEPRIAGRFTLVWIGGAERPGLGLTTPPNASAVEYNLHIDPAAARIVLNGSTIPLWQVPRATYRQTLLSQVEVDRRIRPHGAIGALLADSIDAVTALGETHGFSLGETYIYGDSPLVLLTALQSSFEADPSSSSSVVVPAPTVAADGTETFSDEGRPIRVFTGLDLRLLFEDLFGKLAAYSQSASASGVRSGPAGFPA